MMKAIVDSVEESKRDGYLRITLVMNTELHRACPGGRSQRSGRALRESYEVGRDEYASIGSPHEGVEILDEEISVITRLSDEKEAFDRALRMVSFGDNSCRALKTKLMQRGYSPSVADTAVKKLKELGYIDEERQLRRLCSYISKEKLIGEKKLVPLLVAKGYASSDIKRIIAECENDGDIDFRKIKKELTEKYRPSDEREKKILFYKHGF